MTKKEQLEKLLSLGLSDDVLKEMILELSDEHQKEKEKLEEKKKQKEKEKIKRKIRLEQMEYDSFIKEKVGILSKIKDSKGNYYVYTKEELEKMEVKDLLEIYETYEKFQPERLQKAKEEYYEMKREEKEKNNNSTEKSNSEKKKVQTNNNDDNKDKDDELSLEELAEKMTIDEMNTILNMKHANNYDKDILRSIADRLGTDIEKLEEIAEFKEKNLKTEKTTSNEKTENNIDNKLKPVDFETQKQKKVKNVSTSSEEPKSKPKIDTEAEPPKKALGIKEAMKNLKDKMDGKAHIAILAVAALAAIILANPGLAFAAGAGWFIKEYNAGKKL